MQAAVRESEALSSSTAMHEFPIEQVFDDLAARWDSSSSQFARLEFVERELEKEKMKQVLEELDGDVIKLQSVLESLYAAPFRDVARQWHNKLGTAKDVLEMWLKVQADRWKLTKVFESPELSRQLQDSKRFHRTDQRWLKLLKRAREISFVVQCCYGDDRTSAAPLTRRRAAAEAP